MVTQALEPKSSHFVPIEQPTTEPLMYGSSPIKMVDVGRAPSAEQVQGTITRLKEVGVLSPDVRVDIAALIHERNDTAFVRMGSLQRKYVHARFILPDGSGGYRNGRVGDLANLPERERLTVISGPCLFSGSSVTGIDIQGADHYVNYPPAMDGITSPIVEIKTDAALQPYEMDAVLRISGFIPELDSSKQITVALNIPRLEYHLYVLDLYARGLINRAAVEKWFADVDTRAQRIESMITRLLPRHVQVESVNPLAAIEDVIRNGITEGETDLFQTVHDRLSRSGRIWGQVLKRAKPTSFMELSRLSYPVAHLLKAEDKGSTVVVVENPEEIPIMHETVKLLPGIVKGATVVGLFPHPNIVLRAPDQSVIGKQYMYFFNGERKTAMKEVVAANRRSGVVYEADNN